MPPRRNTSSRFTLFLPIEPVDNSFALFRGPSKPMPALFGENIAGDDEDGDTIPQTKSLGIPGQLATTEDNPF